MSNKVVPHKQDKSELEKFKLFYEHVTDSRQINRSSNTSKRSRN